MNINLPIFSQEFDNNFIISIDIGLSPEFLASSSIRSITF